MTANHQPKNGLTIAAFCDPLGLCRIGIWKVLQRHPELAIKVPDPTRQAGFHYIISDPDTLLDMLRNRTHGFRPGERPPVTRNKKVGRPRKERPPVTEKKRIGRPPKQRPPPGQQPGAGGSHGDD